MGEKAVSYTHLDVYKRQVLGGCFVGIGVGIIVRQGGSSGGDDALALVISKVSGWRLSRSYLITALTVLILSLSYIPVRQIGFSLITVTISSFLIDFVQNWEFNLSVRKTSACEGSVDGEG